MRSFSDGQQRPTGVEVRASTVARLIAAVLSAGIVALFMEGSPETAVASAPASAVAVTAVPGAAPSETTTASPPPVNATTTGDSEADAEAPPGPAPAPAPSAAPGPVPVADAAAAPHAAATATATSFSLSFNPDGSTVRWNPCSAITWKANLTLAPAGALDDLEVAFARLSEATGMTFAYGGTTTTIPTDDWLGGAEQDVIVVAWAPATLTDLWTETADGRGGWYAEGTSGDGNNWTWRIVRGFVLIDPATTGTYAGGFGPGLTRGALLLHELAHAVGLAHIDDRSELMYPTLSGETVAAYGDGDLAGLAAIGQSAGCIN